MDIEEKNITYQKFDFVRFKGEVCEVRGVLDHFGINLCNKNGDFFEDVFVKYVEPIEITVELLEKLDYKYSDFTESYCRQGKGRPFTSDYYFDKKKLTVHSMGYDVIKTNVLYVHEMQQVLRLGEFDSIIWWDTFR